MLAAAIAKKPKSEPEVLKVYETASGRRRLEKFITGKGTSQVQDEFRGYKNFLKYWRDESVHGKTSNISEAEAYTSLALLLRYALFVGDRWSELTQP